MKSITLSCLLATLALLSTAVRATDLPAFGAAPARPGTVIYDNFGSDPEHAYMCCSSYTVAGESSRYGLHRSAMAFTPVADARLKNVRIALTVTLGTPQLDVALYADAAGIPGHRIGSVTVDGLPQFPSCCDAANAGGHGHALVGGRTYWIVVTASDDTAANWNFSNTGGSGFIAYDTGAGWQSYFGTPMGAMAVIGY